MIIRAFVFVGYLCISSSAFAQTLSLIAETIVDPGRFSDPPTADVLAVGAMSTFGAGSAADAAVNPAGLLRGPRGDVSASIDTGRLWRDVSTGIAASPETQRFAGAWFPAWFVAGAVRRPTWAAGAFYDGSARHRHEFTTGDRLISQVSSPGGAVFQRISGRTDLSESVEMSRLGGSVAVAPFGPWLSIGGSVELIHTHIDTISDSDLERLSIIRPEPPVTSLGRETIAFTADEWNTGVTVGAGVQPAEWLTVSILRRWAPEFAANVSAETPLTMDLPDLFAAGATVTLSATKFGFEIARIDYAVFNDDDLIAAGVPFLQLPGAAWEPRAGVRHEITIGGSKRLVFSGGIRAEGIHALSSTIATPFVLEPQTRTWITGGGAFHTTRLTVAVAAGAARDERRIIATIGVRSAS